LVVGAVMIAVSAMGQALAADAPKGKEPAKAEAPLTPAKKAADKNINPALKEELEQRRNTMEKEARTEFRIEHGKSRWKMRWIDKDWICG
jgi:hypothetical protein